MSNTTALVATALIIGGAIAWIFLAPTETAPPNSEPQNPVTIQDGTQIITINVKSGYHPRKVVAQAGIPTNILIPALGTRTQLEPKGTKTVPLGTQEKGAVISGGCSMNMYNFNITFQ